MGGLESEPPEPAPNDVVELGDASRSLPPDEIKEIEAAKTRHPSVTGLPELQQESKSEPED